MIRTAIYRCRYCDTVRRIDYAWASIPDGQPEAGSRQLLRTDGARGTPGSEICCGNTMRWGYLQATVSKTRQCDERCTHAKGWICSCACGGANHATAAGALSQLASAPALRGATT